MLMKPRWSSLIATAALVLATSLAQAQTAPDAWIKQISGDVIETVKGDRAIQGGDTKKVMALVDAKILPNVDFQRMTSVAVGRYWRQATPRSEEPHV